MATKKTTKKAAKSNFDKIKATAKKINTEVLDTVEVLKKDVQKNRKTATSSIEKMAMKDSVKKIGSTVKNVNTQVLETATEILDETFAGSKKWGNEIVETAKKRMAKIDMAEGITKVRTSIKNANEFTLETAEDILDGTFKNGEKVQKLTKKAIKGSTKLAERQQEIVFDTLETVKGQLMDSASRLKSILTTKK